MTKKLIIGLIFSLISLIVFFLIISNLLKKKETTTTTYESFFHSQQEPVGESRIAKTNPSATPSFELEIQEDPLVARIKSFLVDNDDFSIKYSPTLKKFVITKKSALADSAINKWFQEHNLEDYKSSNLFVYYTYSKTFEETIRETNPSSNSNNPFSSPGLFSYNLFLLRDFLKTFTSFNASSAANLNLYITPTPTAAAESENPSSPGTIPQNYDSLGLPAPKADGVNGYNALKTKLESNPNALWAAKQLLQGEKSYASRGGTIIKYLTTAWIWFENGAASWPDPYEVNCNDDRSGYSSEVSFFCNSKNFQIAGYQAAERKTNYIDTFRRLYNESELRSVLQNVVDNSHRASKTKWNYKEGGQNKGLITKFFGSKSIPTTVTLNDISPSQDFFSEQGQFFTLILGKDPKMAAALNSFAVTPSFLTQLRSANDSHKLYGYIGTTEVQLISNMMAALYIIDTGSLPSSGFSGGSNIVSWTNQISNNLQAGQICEGWYCKQIGSVSSGSYKAAIRQGYNNSLESSGRYWCTQLVIDSYNLAGKTGLNNSHAGVVNMAKFWQRTAGYKYLDYSASSNHQQILTQVKSGCAMFQESRHGVHTGFEHAAIVREINIKNGNGYIVTYDANGPKKTSRYIIDDWQITNNFYSYVSFGC